MDDNGSDSANPLPNSNRFHSPAPSPPHPDPAPTPAPDRRPDDVDWYGEIGGRLHRELEKKLDLKEVHGERHSHDQRGEAKEEGEEEEEVNSWESGGEGEEDHKHENHKNGGEEEEDVRKNYWRYHDSLSSSDNNHQHPLRPEAEDCAYYMKTGNCKFGANCKFNHPVNRRKTQVVRDKVTEKEEAPERPGQMECKYYLRTGGCKYGKACRYNHSRVKPPVFPGKTPVFPILELNFMGLPIRRGERECPYYMRNGSCKYETNCKFNHPDPTAVGGSDPSSAFGNGGSASLQVSSQSSLASWSSPGALNETAPYMPIMFPPTQGVAPQSPEWNGYQAPVYPSEKSMPPPAPAPAYVISNPAPENNVYAHKPQQQMPVDEYPERPGQPECSYFLKTGDCKFKSYCKFHHPKNRVSKPPPCALSDKGLPLRPDQIICQHYSRYGICKFGPACKFDHPIQPSSTATTDDRPDSYGNTATKEETSESGNGGETSVQTGRVQIFASSTPSLLG